MNASDNLPELPKINIRRADFSDLPAVARVHISAFQGFFLTELGPRFLRAYYATVLEHPGGILLVAEMNGHVSGFVAGFSDPVRFYRRMRKNKWRFLLPVALGVVRNPRLLRRVVVGTRRVRRAHAPPGSPSEVCCELSSVAVDPGLSCRGVGRQLVAWFVESASKGDAKCVFLTTDAVNNDHVNAFYRKCGFHLNTITDETAERPMNQYLMELNQVRGTCSDSSDRYR